MKNPTIVIINDPASPGLQITDVKIEFFLPRGQNKNRRALGLKVTVWLEGMQREEEPFFSLVPADSCELLLTVTCTEEYSLHFFLADPGYTFTGHSGGIDFHDHEDIVQLFKSLRE